MIFIQDEKKERCEDFFNVMCATRRLQWREKEGNLKSQLKRGFCDDEEMYELDDDCEWVIMVHMPDECFNLFQSIIDKASKSSIHEF